MFALLEPTVKQSQELPQNHEIITPQPEPQGLTEVQSKETIQESPTKPEVGSRQLQSPQQQPSNQKQPKPIEKGQSTEE